jgi:hypothetical protein
MLLLLQELLLMLLMLLYLMLQAFLHLNHQGLHRF